MLTLALAMLAFSRFSKVETPESECSTSCTRCCICASVGAGPSTGELTAAPSSTGAEVGPSVSEGAGPVLKSGLKLSEFSIGRKEGGAAIARAQACDVLGGRWFVVIMTRGTELQLGSDWSAIKAILVIAINNFCAQIIAIIIINRF